TMTQAGSTSLANDFETLANTQTLTVQVSDGTRTTTIEVKLNERNVDDIALTSISGALTRANRSAGGGSGIGIGGRTVTLVDANNNVVATTTTAANGSYRFDNVVPGTYAVQFTSAMATSSTGSASGSTVSNISVVPGATVTHVDAVLIDPSGVVYDSVRRTPVRNAQVSLYFGGAKVSNSWLDLSVGGPNDQVTGADGRYSFILAGTASSGTYEIRVTGPSGYNNTESVLIPSSGTVTPALGGGLDNVQPQATAPTGTQATTYYLRFTFTIGTDAASTSNGIGNNHIPIDPVGSPIAFTGTNATDAGNRPSYSFSYNEGRSPGATLGSVSASGGYSATRTFSITGGNTNGWFTIDATTGALTLTPAGATSAANDFEVDPNVHTLTVQVTDGFGTATVEVKLNEVNIDDTAPLITGPSGGAGAAESAVTIDEGLTLATTMSANETVAWSLVGGTDRAKFVIDPSTGALSFVEAPNYESPTDADHNNSYVVQVRATDAAGNVALQTVTVTIRNVDEIARKLAQIADPLRNGLRNYAARSLSDMLSFNEQLLQDGNRDTCNVNSKKPVSGGFNANNQAQSARLSFAKVNEDCARHTRVFVNGAMAASRVHGDWTLRTLAAVRVETDVNPTLTLGAGVLATFADDKLKAFADSSISDTSLQLNLYGRQRLTEKLRVAAYAGYGKAWYDFGLTDNGFVMTGKMTGDRFTYGATLTGDIAIGATALTTDLIVSHAQERLGTARLAASYLGEQRSGIGFFVGNVDVTRLSVPVHLPIDFQKSAYEGGNSARLEISPGLLCEDNSAENSALSCGFRADAKLAVTRGTRTQAYLGATFETVGGMQRYLGGLGFGYRFGPSEAFELGTNLDVGTTGLRQEARAMIQLKLVK
ncbi:MAG: SdrD B-like domain-containing protein, partial [Chakrabartia godavariana]